MSTENKIGRVMRNTGPIRFLLPLSLILIVVGIVLTIIFGQTKNYLETKATVTNVVTENVVDADNVESTNYNLDITYIVDNQNYNQSIEMSNEYHVGDTLTIYYDKLNPNKFTTTKGNSIIGIVIVIAGVAILVISIAITIKKFKESKALDNQKLDDSLLNEYNNRELNDEEQELYCRLDGHTLKPGYIVEDKNRKILYEAINTKNIPALPREFEFVNHHTGKHETHKVTRPFTSTVNDEMFSTTSSIKFDGENIWNYLHNRGIRIETLFNTFPNMTYQISLAGNPIARVVTSSQYVHEEDEEGKKLVLPIGRYYYRIFTREVDLELLFLTIFAISETEQTVVE